jgi:peptidoglycan/LPS O-acetylase OafA/YrhL
MSNAIDGTEQKSAARQTTVAAAPRIRGLDGLRGLAALMLFFYHAWGHSGFPRLFVAMGRRSLDLTSYVRFSGQGVTIFYVLSGFLLSLPFWKELKGGPTVRLSSYFRRRFLRLYPAYMVVVLLLALVYDVKHPLSSRGIMTVSHLLLLHNLTEATIYSISAPLWYIATAFQLYIALPAIFSVLKKRLGRGAPPLRLLAGLFIFGGAAGVVFYGASNALLSHIALDVRLAVPQGRVLLHSPILGLANFCAGIVAGYFYVVLAQSGQSHGSSSPWCEIALYATVLALPSLSQMAIGLIWDWSPAGWPIVSLLFALVVLVTSQSRRAWGLAAVLDVAPLRLLGTVSYSFYLWHDFVLGTVWNRLPATLSSALGSNLAKTACALLITSVLAWVSHQLLELRFGRIVGGLWDRGSEWTLVLASNGGIFHHGKS